jgi:hypothetical protein
MTFSRFLLATTGLEELMKLRRVLELVVVFPRFHLLSRDFRRSKLIATVEMPGEKMSSRANVGLTDSPFWYRVMRTKYWPTDYHFIKNAG